MSETGDVAAAVAKLFDAATAEETRSLRGLTATWARVAGRPIEVEEVDDLEPDVCGAVVFWPYPRHVEIATRVAVKGLDPRP